MAAAVRRAQSNAAPNGPRTPAAKSTWTELLESVTSGRRIPEKILMILDSQKAFLAAFAADASGRPGATSRSVAKQPPIANRYALGYTYQDVLETDQDERDKAFASLLKPLLNPKSVQDICLVVLLDWGEPWKWLHQLRDWIRAIRQVFAQVDADVQDALDENIKHWQHRRKGPKAENTTSSLDYDGGAPPKLGPGEWDEPLGVPICIVCQEAEKMEILEREHGWREDDFDTVLIFLRTVLLKHGGALIYTASAAAGQLQNMLHSTLDIKSILQRPPLKHNVNDRDKVTVPPNWDSWGKIRPLREVFDFETVSKSWSADIAPNDVTTDADKSTAESAVLAFEELVKDPQAHTRGDKDKAADKDTIETPCEPNQTFFARQLEVLEAFKTEDEQVRKKAAAALASQPGARKPTSEASTGTTSPRISEQIGPVAFNMGGIGGEQEEAPASKGKSPLDFIAAPATPQARGASPSGLAAGGIDSGPTTPLASAGAIGKGENDALRSFFASLASRGGASPAPSSTGANTPRGDR